MARTTTSTGRARHREPDCPEMDTSLFSVGDRVCVAVSGGADSTALLRLLLERRAELGIVLSVVHVEHGLRGEAAAGDAAFVAELAHNFDLSCYVVAVNTPQRAAVHRESVEEAARNLRYGVFGDLLAAGRADKIATAHTLDDQAETVLMKLLRGAWTEGLSGIHPVLWLDADDGRHSVVRPLLAAKRSKIEAYLRKLGQPWREDETNRSVAFTRNRLRHDLLPVLRDYNPRIEEMLAHMAANARAEEQHWQAELARLLPQLLREGKPVRGGGRRVDSRAEHTSLALEIARLSPLDPALQRRVLRATAERCGATLDFAATERLLAMVAQLKALDGRGKLRLPGNVRVERSLRELQFTGGESDAQEEFGRDGMAESSDGTGMPCDASPIYELPVPGSVEAPALQARYTAAFREEIGPVEECRHTPSGSGPGAVVLHVRAWQPGDRVRLRYSSKPKKVKEVLERMGIRGAERRRWPVIESGGRIVWMRGVDLAPDEEQDCGVQPMYRFQIVEERLGHLAAGVEDVPRPDSCQ